MKIELDSSQIIITFSERIGIKLNDVLFYVSAYIRELFDENIITINHNLKQKFFKRKNNLGNNYIRCGILYDSTDRILQYNNFIHDTYLPSDEELTHNYIEKNTKIKKISMNKILQNYVSFELDINSYFYYCLKNDRNILEELKIL